MIRVYEYGCLSPVQGEQAAIDQIFRRHRLWNSLVEVENRIRAQAREALSDEESEEKLEALRQQSDAIRSEMKARRKQARSKKIDISDLQLRLDETKTALRAAYESAKAVRQSRRSERKDELDKLSELRKTEVKTVVHAAQLYWGNYDDVLASYNTARFKKTPLRFHPTRPEGKVNIRYQTGLPVPQAFENDTRFRLSAYTSKELATMKVKNPKARHVVHLRVGSEAREPIWFSLPVVLHRPLPEEGIIKSAAVTRRCRG